MRNSFNKAILIFVIIAIAGILGLNPALIGHLVCAQEELIVPETDTNMQEIPTVPQGTQEVITSEAGQSVPEDILHIEKVSQDKDLYSIELRDVEIKDFLRILAFRYKLNILMDKDVSGRVTASFNSIGLEEALTAVLKINGYVFKKEGSIIKVSGAMVTEIIRLGYMQVETLLGMTTSATSTESTTDTSSSSGTAATTDTASATSGTASTTSTTSTIYDLLSAQGKILPGQEPNTIMVIDYPDNIEKIKEYVKMVDIQPEQVIIDARVVEVTLDDSDYLTVNFDWLKPDDTFRWTNTNKTWDISLPYKGDTDSGAFSLGLVNSSIDVTIEALSIHVDTDLLSAPRIATSNKKKAMIDIVQELPYLKEESTTSEGVTTVTKELLWKYVGIKLEVTPTINPDHTISMYIKPEINELVAWSRELPQWGSDDPNAPVVDTRSAETNVTVRDGQTIVLGGLVKNKFDLNITKVPLLGDIPLLGHLFRSKKYVKVKKELLIFVEPRIISQDLVKKMMMDDRYGAGKTHRIEKERREAKIEQEYLKEQRNIQAEKEYEEKMRLQEQGVVALPEQSDTVVDGDKDVKTYPDYYEKSQDKRKAENEALRKADRMIKQQEKEKTEDLKKKIRKEDKAARERHKSLKGGLEYLRGQEFQKIDEANERFKENYTP